MRYAPITDRLAGLGGDKWALHARAKAMVAAGQNVIALTIGEPDIAPDPVIARTAAAAIASGRIGYSTGSGEPGLLSALARRYSGRAARPVAADQILAFPGTQTALYAVLTALLAPGEEVLVGDPMYATYLGLIRATGAEPVPVPLRPENGFRIEAAAVAARVTPRARVLFLNTPHNPTGAVLSRADLEALGEVARAHDLWIVCDEVYEALTFGAPFVSPFDLPDLASRTVVASSISKSHAAPGYRSGWCVGPRDFAARLLPLAETMLFGNQPFIADATEAALAETGTAEALRAALAARAALVHRALDGSAGLAAPMPEAGMFALVDVRATGLSGEAFAWRLLDEAGVAVMPGSAFGETLAGWLRLGLTRPEPVLAEACRRIAGFAAGLQRRRA